MKSKRTWRAIQGTTARVWQELPRNFAVRMPSYHRQFSAVGMSMFELGTPQLLVLQDVGLGCFGATAAEFPSNRWNCAMGSAPEASVLGKTA